MSDEQRYLSPEDLLSWRTKHMGLTQREAAELLGWARGALGPAERDEGAPKYIALAAAALLLKIPPYGSSAWKRWYRRNKRKLARIK